MIDPEKAYQDLMSRLNARKPFAFARFNDGEMNVILNGRGPIARGDQEATPELRTALKSALKCSSHGFVAGGPCYTCFKAQRMEFNRLVMTAAQVPATTFCNGGRWLRFVQDFVRAASRFHSVVWVGGRDQDMARITELFGRTVTSLERVPARNAMNHLTKVQTHLLAVPEGSLVCMACGPLSRVLAHRIWKARQDITLFDAGSLFDPYSRNVWHACHKGTLRLCPECNPIPPE